MGRKFPALPSYSASTSAIFVSPKKKEKKEESSVIFLGNLENSKVYT